MLKVVQVFRFGVDVKSSWSLCKYEQRVETTWNGTHLALLTHVRTPLPNLYRTSWHAINHESYKSTTPFTTLFDREIYHLCLHALPSSKSPSVDKIPNKIIKTLLPKHHGALYNLSTYLYHHNWIPFYWKHNKSILLYKKERTTLMPKSLSCFLWSQIYGFFCSNERKMWK